MQTFSTWILSIESIFSRSSRRSGTSVNGPYFIYVILSGNILHASRCHSINYFMREGNLIERGTLLQFLLENRILHPTRERCLAELLEKGCLIELLRHVHVNLCHLFKQHLVINYVHKCK